MRARGLRPPATHFCVREGTTEGGGVCVPIPALLAGNSCWKRRQTQEV